MKKFKKFLKVLLIVLVSLIGVLFATPYLFKSKIVALVKSEINKKINAKVDFKEVNISFFRHFPKVSIGLDELEVTGTGVFERDTLISAKRLDASVDFMSFFRGKNMNIYAINLEWPRIHALVTKKGYANWDIMKPVETTEDASSGEVFNLQLQVYEIENGYLRYDDKEADMSAEIINFNHSGTGDFTSDLFTLKTTTKADAVTFVYGLIPYLASVKTIVDADVKIDNKNNTYSFEGVDAMLNALKINGNGNIKSLSGGYGMDISFKSASADFKNILSLVPAIYKTEFDKVTAAGTANFEGLIKGTYNDSTMPGYHIDMSVKDGSFKYTDLPKALKQINFNMVVDNPDGITDHTVVNIKNGHLAIDNEPFDFRLLIKNPVSNMFVDAVAKGKLDLSQVAGFVKLDKGTSLTGLLKADVDIKGNVNDIEKQQFDKFYAGGTIDVNNFNYTSANYPTGVKINNVNTVFTPSKINVANLSGEYMKSKFNGGGQINNLLSYLLSGKPLSADFTVNADQVNLNDWLGVSADTAATGAAAAPFVVPANLNVNLNTKVDRMKYDNIHITDLSGNLKIAEEVITLNNVSGKALDGTISINGSYSTKDSKTKPTIALSYDVNQVDIQKTFYAFNTVQKLMPIGKYLAGKLTSVMSANGKLGDNMSIDMNTLSGNGNLFLIEGLLSKFAPLDKIASTLNVKALQQISMQDVKTFFDFSNGKLLVKPFTVKIKDIEMEIGGLQGFDQTLNYAINVKLPRALMGTQGNQLVNNLAVAASSKGIPVNLGETINLKMEMGGTILKPVLKVDLKQSGETLATQMQQQVKDFAQAKIDSAKLAAKDTLNSLKKQLGDAAKDEIKKQLFGIKDTTAVNDSIPPSKTPQQKKTESVKGLLNNILKKKQKDTVNQQQ